MASYYPGSDRAFPISWPALSANEGERPVGYKPRLLVRDEVPGLQNKLQLEGTGSRCLLANGPRRNGRVPLPDEEQRGHLEGQSGVASG